MGSVRSAYMDKLVYIMKVDESMSFDEYWKDDRFIEKKPVFNKGAMFMYGDNIYHHENGKWVQELSHHSKEDGGYNYNNLSIDTRIDRVLISREYYYFGNNAIDIPDEYLWVINKGIGHGVVKEEEKIGDFLNYIRKNFEIGINGVPYSRVTGRFANYGGR